MIHRVTLTTTVDRDLTVEHTFEHLVEEAEDARQAGHDDALLVKAWSEGFAEADLT